MPPSLSTRSLSFRIRAALRRPSRITVGRYLAARRRGELAVEDEFFWQLQLASGVFKATNRHRLDDTFELIRAALPVAVTKLRILDVACSSGISTVELHEALSRPGVVIDTIGTDIATKVMHATVEGGDAVIYDLDGTILAAEIDGMLINRRPDRAVRLHHPWRVRRAHALITKHSRAGSFGPPATSTVSEVPLVSSVIAQTRGVQVVEEDLFHPTVGGTFDLIRAANILNRGYFSDAKLRACVEAILGRLVVGGLLFVVRTDVKTNHGTLWRVVDTGVAELGRIGRGCEIQSLVEDVARTTSSPSASSRS